MKNMKKVLALLLTVVMVFGMFPVHAVAVDDAAQACEHCGTVDGHKEDCVDYIAPGCAECAQVEGHLESCSAYVAPATEQAVVAQACQNCGAVDGHKEDCVDYVAPGCAECAQVEAHLESCSAYVAPATEQAVVYEAEAAATVTEAAVSAQSKVADAQVRDKLWIKSGTSVYKSPEDSKGKEVALPYHIEIVAIEAVGETVWYQFELIDISAVLGSGFLKNYNWIKSEDTTTEKPSDTETPDEPGVTEAPKDPVDQNDCNCGENAPENLAHHADSCPRKQYIKTLFEGKTAQEIHTQWANYDEVTRSDLLEMLAVYDAAKHAELQKLINGGSEEPDAVEEAYEKLLAAKSQKEYDEIYSKLDASVKEQLTDEQKENLNDHLDDLPQFNVTADGKEMSVDVTGPIPENCEVDVTLAEDDQISAFNFDEDTDVLMVVDVTIYDENGVARQPDEGKPITISFDVSGLGLKDGDHCAVYHKHGNEEPEVSCHVVVNGHINYEADRLSPVALAAEYPLDGRAFNSSKLVYWDVAVAKSGSGFPTHQRGDASRVTAVTLNDKPVVKGNSAGTSPRAWSFNNTVRANSLSTYYPGTSTGRESDVRNLTITPAKGYYVTGITVACTASQRTDFYNLVCMDDAYHCGTWESGNEYQRQISYDPNGTVTIELPSLAFCHLSAPDSVNKYIYGELPLDASGTNEFFILIEVAPVPSPLYVEYQYGNITNYISDNTQKAKFTNSTTWVTTDSRNAGTHAMDTSNTQIKYYYNAGLSESQKAEEVAKWKHFAGGISPEAAAAAASAGYVFSGWKATYYTTCSSLKNATPNPNNYSYGFTTQHGAETTYLKGDNVPLHTHVKLVAQWEKAPKLTVKKVTVNDTDPNVEFTFNVQLGNNQESFYLKNGESRSFVAPKGTQYTVTESANGNYTTTNSGNTTGSLNSDVTVTFTNTRKTASVTVKKLVEGETEDTGFAFSAKLWADSTKNRTIPFPDNIGTGITRSSDSLSATFTLNHNNEAITFNNLPVGAVLEVTETNSQTADSTTNDTNPTNNGKTATYSIVAGATKTITFTNTYVPKTSSVVVKKEVVDNHNLYNGEKFEFTVSMKDGSDLPNGEKTMTFELGHGEEMTIADVKIGSVLVIEESEYENYSTTNTHGLGRRAEVTVVKEPIPTVIFTNTVIAYTLTIEKVWTGDVAAPDKTYPVEVRINGNLYNGDGFANGVLNMKVGESYTIEHLPVGTTYSVSENIDDVTAPNGFEFAAPIYQITGEDAVTVAPLNKKLTADTAVTITNELIGVYGDLMITKTGILDVDNHENKNDGFRFEEEQSTIYRVQGQGIDMQVAIVGNNSVTIKHVPLGDYTVTELENWSWRYDADDADAGIKKTTVTAGYTAEVPFENTRTEKYWLSGDTHCENWWGGSNGTKLVRKDET